MTLYEYLKKNLARSDPHPAIDHSMRAELHADGRISFYIHPERRDGETPTFWISDAGVFEKSLTMSPQKEFLTHPENVRAKRLQEAADAQVLSGKVCTAILAALRLADMTGWWSEPGLLLVRDVGPTRNHGEVVGVIESVDGIKANYQGFDDYHYHFKPSL